MASMCHSRLYWKVPCQDAQPCAIRFWERPMTSSPHSPPQPRIAARRAWLGSGEGLGLLGVLILGGCLLLALVFDSNGDLLYEVNEYVVWLLLLALLGAVTEAGYWLGRRAKARHEDETAASDEHTREVQTALF